MLFEHRMLTGIRDDERLAGAYDGLAQRVKERAGLRWGPGLCRSRPAREERLIIIHD
jgi:hypothetical protein